MSVTSPETLDEKSVTLDLLKALTPLWLELRQRYDRSEHFDAKLGREYTEANDCMNELLQTYHVQLLGEVAIDGIEHEKIIQENDAWTDYYAENKPPAQGYSGRQA